MSPKSIGRTLEERIPKAPIGGQRRGSWEARDRLITNRKRVRMKLMLVA